MGAREGKVGGRERVEKKRGELGTGVLGVARAKEKRAARRPRGEASREERRGGKSREGMRRYEKKRGIEDRGFIGDEGSIEGARIARRGKARRETGRSWY